MNPILSATPAPLSAQSYNPGMAETFSWVPMDGAGRPLFAKAVYATGLPQQLMDDVAAIKILLAAYLSGGG